MSDSEHVILRGEGGKFLPGTRPPNTIKTPEDARNLVRLRWEKARRIAASAVAEELKAGPKPLAAWGILNADLARKVLESDKPREEAVRSLGQNMGALPLPGEMQTQAAQQVPDNQMPAALVLILRVLTKDNEPYTEYTDGEVSE